MVIYSRGDEMDDVENGFEIEAWPYRLFKKHNQYYMTYYNSGEFEITKEGFLRRLEEIFNKFF